MTLVPQRNLHLVRRLCRCSNATNRSSATITAYRQRKQGLEMHLMHTKNVMLMLT